MSARIEEVLETHKAELLALPGVVGVAQGVSDGAPCIRVFATEDANIPQRLEGFPVKVSLTHAFEAWRDVL